MAKGRESATPNTQHWLMLIESKYIQPHFMRDKAHTVMMMLVESISLIS